MWDWGERVCTDELTPHFWKTLSPLHNSFEWLGLGGCVCTGCPIPVTTAIWNKGGHLTKAELLYFSVMRHRNVIRSDRTLELKGQVELGPE